MVLVTDPARSRRGDPADLLQRVALLLMTDWSPPRTAATVSFTSPRQASLALFCRKDTIELSYFLICSSGMAPAR